MSEAKLRSEVKPPSALGADELAAWRRMQLESPALQRAFLTPSFALACERANANAHVAVLHTGGVIRGFFPFQFRSVWHRTLGLGERIGGGLSDAAGVIADADLRTDAPALLRLARLSSFAVTHLMPGQDRLGLDAEWSRIGHVTDIRQGPAAYFAALLQRDRLLVRDTERRMRRAEAAYGALQFSRTDRIPPDMIAVLIQQKREQYRRTQVSDAFARQRNVRLIDAMRETSDPECRLVMSSLEGGGRMLAQHLGPQYHDVLSHWFPVYDHEARNVSPGRLLLWHMLQRAADDGIGLIDFGEGDAVYKQEFATASTRFGGGEWYRGSIRGRIARGCRALEWRWAAHLQRRLKQPAPQG